MKTFFTKTFRKNYRKRISFDKNLRNKFHERYNLFLQDPQSPILSDHFLIGKMKGYRAFSITGDIRVVYYIHEGIAHFTNIGTHNQVY